MQNLMKRGAHAKILAKGTVSHGVVIGVNSCTMNINDTYTSVEFREGTDGIVIDRASDEDF